MEKLVAVVILNWNGKNYLEKFLPSLIQNTPNQIADIIIADNFSTDNSIPFLNENFPKIKIIQFDQNYGFTGGYNKALAQIEAKYYVLLNSDVETPPNWLEPLVQFMEKNEDYAACQPKLLSYSDKSSFEYAGAAGGFIDIFGYPFCRGRIMNTIEKDKGQFDSQTDIFWASGACLFIRAKDWKRENGLDDLFFAHMEEIDLCWRLQNHNKKIAYIPDSKIYHVGGGSLPNSSPFKLYLNHRNNLYLLYKNLPKGKLIPILFIRLILDGVSAVLYLMQGKLFGPKMVLKAHFSFYKHAKKLKRNNRKEFVNLIYKKSIVIDYFIKKRKTFKSINMQ